MVRGVGVQLSLVNVEAEVKIEGVKVRSGILDKLGLGRIFGKPKVSSLTFGLAGTFPTSIKLSDAKAALEKALKEFKRKGERGRLVLREVTFGYKVGFVFREDLVSPELVELLESIPDGAINAFGELDAADALDEPYVEGFRLYLWPETSSSLRKILDAGYNLVEEIQLRLSKEYISLTPFLVLEIEKGKGAAIRAKIEDRLREEGVRIPEIVEWSMEDRDRLVVALTDYRVLKAVGEALGW